MLTWSNIVELFCRAHHLH